MYIYVLKMLELFLAGVNVRYYQNSCFGALVLMFFAWKQLKNMVLDWVSK